MGPSFIIMSNKKKIPVGTISNKSTISNNKGSMSHDVPVRIISNKSDVGIISNKPNTNTSNNGNTSSGNKHTSVLSKVPAKCILKTQGPLPSFLSGTSICCSLS